MRQGSISSSSREMPVNESIRLKNGKTLACELPLSMLCKLVSEGQHRGCGTVTLRQFDTEREYAHEERSFVATLKTEMAISFLSARSLFRIARTNAVQGNVGTKDIWLGKAPRSLRRRFWPIGPNRGAEARNTSQLHPLASIWWIRGAFGLGGALVIMRLRQMAAPLPHA